MIYRIFYSEPDGFKEQALHEAWNKIEGEGIIQSLFFDGYVQTYKDFREYMKQKNTLPFTLYKDKDLAGFFWLNNFVGRSAQIHCTAFRNSIGRRRYSYLLGRICISYALCLNDKHGYVIDTVIGYTPITNRLAVKYNERAGMIKVGEIPNRCSMFYENTTVAAVVTYATRETMKVTDMPCIWTEAMLEELRNEDI